MKNTKLNLTYNCYLQIESNKHEIFILRLILSFLVQLNNSMQILGGGRGEAQNFGGGGSWDVWERSFPPPPLDKSCFLLC